MSQVFAISPKHTTLDFPNGWTLDDKIDVFVARIVGWQIGIAKEIIQKGINHSGFAILHIVFSYFEMLGKYLDGYTGRESKKHFRRGVKATFPEMESDADVFLDLLYSSVRNGLYHTGMTKINVALLSSIQGSIGFNAERKLLAINPDRLVEDLDIRFHQYISELRNPQNTKLRENFERRFDYDNSEISL